MKTKITTLSLLLISLSSFGQVVLTENFDYPDGNLVGNGTWAAHSGTGSPVQVVSNEIVITHGSGSREDVNIPFTSASNEIYASFDFKVADLGSPISGTDFEYFAHFTHLGGYKVRLDIVAPSGSGDFSVGIASGSGTAEATWASDFSYDTTYRATMKYDKTAGQAQLWIDASVEADTSILGSSGSVAEVGNLSFRQSDSSSSETIMVDNIIVSESFEDSLLSIESAVLKDEVKLYPNPAKTGNVKIEGLEDSTSLVNVFNSLGQEVFVNKTNNNLDISNLTSGVYFVKIKDSKGKVTVKKLMVK